MLFLHRKGINMGMLRPILGGIIGGVVGVFIWVEVGYFTHLEVGWIAWGVGFLVGVGVRYAAYMGEQEASTALGFMSAGMAICCILIAKFLVFTLLIKDISSSFDNIAFNVNYDESAIAELANEIVTQKNKQGTEIKWPEGMTAEDASAKEDYPPQIWQEAEKKWNQLDPQEREKKKQDMKKETDLLKHLFTPSFKDSFRFWDLLWFALATITAYKIGIGTYGTD
jgi:hypothetical protein